MTPTVVSVKQLNLYIKSLLEGNQRLAYISICGELSNFKRHFASGHMYFTLKDDAAALKCVMFRDNAARLKFIPQDGMQVVCTGRISVYERDGVYQLYAENMTFNGEGDLMFNFEKLKEKLTAEGLFDQKFKKPIPKFPKKVAVITSETGAAVQDILNVLGRRFPLAEVLLCPATVQGDIASKSIISALSLAEEQKPDVIIVGRGGGSAQDLWCFNDEALARKIFSLKTPVISAVGHETDFTICDFVADLRAPTPSAAAELAVPQCEELLENISLLNNNLSSLVSFKVEQKEKALKAISSKNFFTDPVRAFCEVRALQLDSALEKINTRAEKVLTKKETTFNSTLSKIDALSPLKTMLRGYTVATKKGKTVIGADQLSVGEKITLRFHNGNAECNVETITKE